MVWLLRTRQARKDEQKRSLLEAATWTGWLVGRSKLLPVLSLCRSRRPPDVRGACDVFRKMTQRDEICSFCSYMCVWPVTSKRCLDQMAENRTDPTLPPVALFFLRHHAYLGRHPPGERLHNSIGGHHAARKETGRSCVFF